MELKLAKKLQQLSTLSVFKLYLYGIEITYVQIIVIRITMFKLYLYGIEIGEMDMIRKNLIKFKLYLYGIEILIILTVFCLLLSSNCTFMELKSLCTPRSLVRFWTFKLYLYGIEIWVKVTEKLSLLLSSNCTFMELK